jgi:hypothetical protein
LLQIEEESATIEIKNSKKHIWTSKNSCWSIQKWKKSP